MTVKTFKVTQIYVSVVFNIDKNQKCFLSSKSAWMISEGSRDTENWSNAENSALITGIKYITLENTQYNRNISVMHFPSNAAIVGIMQIQSIITNLFIFNLKNIVNKAKMIFDICKFLVAHWSFVHFNVL